MQRKTRVVLRAAKYLEFEAREYVEAAKEDREQSLHFGRKAGVMFGTAYALRELAATGYTPTSAAEKSAGLGELNHYRKLIEKRQRRYAAPSRNSTEENK